MLEKTINASCSDGGADVTGAINDGPIPEPLSATINATLRWKTDLVILPLTVLTSTLAFLDKV